MNDNFWKGIAAQRTDNAAREALGAVRTLAQEGLERWGECATYLAKILAVIDDSMLPKTKKKLDQEAPPMGVDSGICEDVQCLSKGLEPRKLYLVGGVKICLGCRKRIKREGA